MTPPPGGDTSPTELGRQQVLKAGPSTDPAHLKSKEEGRRCCRGRTALLEFSSLSGHLPNPGRGLFSGYGKGPHSIIRPWLSSPFGPIKWVCWTQVEPGLLRKAPPGRQTCLQTGSWPQEPPLEKWSVKAGGLAGRINITVKGRGTGGGRDRDNSVARSYSRDLVLHRWP